MTLSSSTSSTHARTNPYPTLTTVAAPSTSSPPTASEPSSTCSARRTRCRFTSAQLALLEQLYHYNSHPSREEREAVAREGNVYVNFFSRKLVVTKLISFRELRSVTVWFQNKRQMDRRLTGRSIDPPGPSSVTQRSCKTLSRTLSAPAPTADITNIHRAPMRKTASLSTLSLDVYASRIERLVPSTPRRPLRAALARSSTLGADMPLWDLMSASPPSPRSAGSKTEESEMLPELPSSSPEATRSFVEFGRRTRCTTLEWACAAARLAPGEDREKGLTPVFRQRMRSSTRSSSPTTSVPETLYEDEEDDLLPVPVDTDTADTEDEGQEALTPACSMAGDDVQWAIRGSEDAKIVVDQPPHDEETMTAALVLCGLNRG